MNNVQVNQTHDEPLGYQHFLYDVNIEYSKGGNQTYSDSNAHSFKLKYLPYMILNHNHLDNNSNDKLSDYCSPTNSSNSSINCDHSFYKSTPPPPPPPPPPSSSSSLQTQPDNTTQFSKHNQSCSIHHPIQDPRHLDVTKETCAFLGNSEYVPNYHNNQKNRRVVLELISAKLSQATSLPTNLSNTSLITLAEQQTITQPDGSVTPVINRRTMTSETNNPSETSSNLVQLTSHSLPTSPAPPITTSSKRFVNYTLLIKTTPGLDKHPTVIERRFSDFLQLYQSFKANQEYSYIIDRYINFPKKVYMGNFSLTNIAERSIEFMRMLTLCMGNVKLLWSVPFISFLLDKELKEAHRLSMFGDPDEVQAIIETSYYIQQKLYVNTLESINKSPSTSADSSIVSESSGLNSFQENSNNCPQTSTNNDAISTIQTNFNNNEAKLQNSDPIGCVSNDDVNNSLLMIKRNLGPLNQRILVTYCMLFLTYYQAENYAQLKSLVDDFSRMISSQEYVDSLLNTRHYIKLRACLLFLMNMNKADIISETHRLWLKRRLEEVDGAHADLLDIVNVGDPEICTNNDLNSPKNRRRGNSVSCSPVIRVTKGDLTNLIRDRNFCLFQD